MKVTEVNAAEQFSLNNALNSKRIKEDYYTDRQVYVPTIKVSESEDLSMTQLINSSTRCYLKVPDPAYTNESTSPEHAGDSLFGNDDYKGVDTGDSHHNSVLDLGTVTLQRVITQMKGMRNNSKGDHDLNFNPHAATTAGLLSYTSFIRGKGVREKPIVELIK